VISLLADVARSTLLVQNLVEELLGLATADTTLGGEAGRFSHLGKRLHLAGTNQSTHGSVGHGVTAANIHRDLLSVMLLPNAIPEQVGCWKKKR
jgi:hypothetical protein